MKLNGSSGLSDIVCSECATWFFCRLQQWVRRKNLDAPSAADAGPTLAIRCPHGELLPEQAPGAKRVLVPDSLWNFISEDASAVKPDDCCMPFDSKTGLCPQCCDELSEVACMEDSLRSLTNFSSKTPKFCIFGHLEFSYLCLCLCCRAVKLKQRQNHEKLATGKGIPLSLNCKYYLVPSSWLVKWRNYVTTSGKNISSSMEPESLDIVIDSLKCEKVTHTSVRVLC